MHTTPISSDRREMPRPAVTAGADPVTIGRVGPTCGRPQAPNGEVDVNFDPLIDGEIGERSGRGERRRSRRLDLRLAGRMGQ